MAALKRTPKPTGYVIYRGPSLLDGAPIVVIAITKRSKNAKTGGMVQTHILREDVSPLEAIVLGLDASICGLCPHRGLVDLIAPASSKARKRSCYVNVGQGPTVVWKKYRRGGYPEATLDQLASIGGGRAVRLGTYGDPAAVPMGIWTQLLRHATGHTGYTHQWRKAPDYLALCMASADSEADRLEALELGGRTFRVRTADEPLLPGEFICPASKEGGKRTLCETCLLCSGQASKAKSPVIISHGTLAGNFRKAA